MATQTPGLGTPLLKKRTGASALGEARMSYRDYQNPYSARMPGYMDALIAALPGGIAVSFARRAAASAGGPEADQYAVYRGGPQGKPPPGPTAGMTRAEVAALRDKWDKVSALAAAGISSTAAEAARKAGAQNVDQGAFSPGEQVRMDRAAARSRQAAGLRPGHPGGRRGSQSVSSSRSSP
jgi:hypothetical protein